MKKNIFILLFGFFNLFSAQNGYEISIKTKGIAKDVLYLKIFNGTVSDSYAVDSAKINEKTPVAKFVQKQKILGGIYKLELKSNKSALNILVNNGAKISFNLEGNVLLGLMAEQQPNIGFLTYERQSGNMERKLELLKDVQKKFPSPTLDLYTKLEEKKNIKIPESLEERKKIQANFLSDLDLNDRRIQILPNSYQFLNKYFNILPIDNENYKIAVDKLLKVQNCDSKNYLFYLKWIFKNLEYNSQKEMNDTYKYTFNTYLNDMKCVNKNETFYKSIAAKLSALEAVPIGSMIANSEMQKLDKTLVNLSDIYAKSKYTFVMFYDPDCVHCQQETPGIVDYIVSLRNSGTDIQSVAYLNTPDDKKWQSFVQEKGLQNWVNVKSKNNDRKYVEKLEISSNPSFLLLDSEGKVLLKKYNQQEIAKILMSLKN
ncbi:thioredoxin family protein [Chryseobacterium sp. Ch-15]|uniref:Redoxin domain-containing protein n=1 Tax=Chryseobacterium muglaense TaxID=2893752 RepID=A0A9Q3UU86_9FLAO|nr:thioredoxin-like domain-containing protein [Chryseobacterium muglaense]MBD3903611.1 redoxin domain-containing protein [Chryseobacterium muglaense]MCC9034682.1 thioredoxin family protein [Chryseobacterium muglaense]MCM2552945.1 thioredoxin family protein [Chryseobacterium muglaense]